MTEPFQLTPEMVRELAQKAQERIENENVCTFATLTKPLFLIAATYPGVWLEHAYDSVLYAQLFPGRNDCLVNFLNLWLEKQTDEGQLPCFAMRKTPGNLLNVGYSQIQECLSFGRVCLMAHEILQDMPFLQRLYDACEKWVTWLRNNRMTTNRGLVEMFVGYDTGHDDSGRLNGLLCTGNYEVDGVSQNASVCPPNDPVAPILAVDMNCNFYGNLMALAEMSRLLQNGKEAEWLSQAEAHKQLLFALCYDASDAFFYDVDKYGSMRRNRSSTIFHLFLEGVLDPVKDAECVDAILRRHILNPEEFWTEYPFPSMAVNDPATQGHPTRNCWGYYSQALIALRCGLWMDKYGLSAQYDILCRQWLTAYTRNAEIILFGQEIDPLTGAPTLCASYYSAGMLLYIQAAKRLHYID